MVDFTKKQIGLGAEAEIWQISEDLCEKIRLKKPYRIEILDSKLRKQRTKREFKILQKLIENDVNVPKPFKLNIDKDKIAFTFEYLGKEILKPIITKKLLFQAFGEIIKMHNLDIVHGDLTTLNMILKHNKIYLIDFGLAEVSNKIENKAVDLNLFFNSIKNEHPELYEYKAELITQYLNKVKLGLEIIQRLEKIEHRGRNKK